MAVIIVCKDGMRFGRDVEPQAGAVGCVVGLDYVIAKATGETDGETKLPIFAESHRIAIEAPTAAKVANAPKAPKRRKSAKA